MNSKKIIIDSVAHWIGSHKRNLPYSSIRGLSNLIEKDFLSVPNVTPHHKLKSSGICKSCNKSGVSYKEFDKTFRRWGRSILKKRIYSNLMFDQAPVKSEQAFQNIAYIISNISNEKQFAFLGDDDFHSLLLARLLPKLKITVFEKDIRIIGKIKEIADSYNLNISVVEIDLAKNIPRLYQNRFDSFYSDPPYSKNGIFTFLYNGLLILKDKRTSWGILAIPFTHLPLQVRELMIEVQLYLSQNGILIEEMIPFFKKSTNKLGIISGIMKFHLIKKKSITSPPIRGKMYNHFY